MAKDKQPDIDCDAALLELAEWAGVEPERLVLTDALLQQAAIVAFARLFYLARRGCRQSAKEILDRFMGAPTQTVTFRAPGMSLSEVREALAAEYRRMGKTEDEALALVEAMERNAEEDAEGIDAAGS